MEINTFSLSFLRESKELSAVLDLTGHGLSEQNRPRPRVTIEFR